MVGVEHQVDVAAPLASAYGFWTQFEDFPRFMDCVEEVRHLDDMHLHWRVLTGGVVHEWNAELVEVRPDERIAWRATDGFACTEVVSFHPLGEAVTGVTVFAEVDDALESIVRSVERDLQCFKAMLESA
jgi:uncharacterized membrane protein